MEAKKGISTGNCSPPGLVLCSKMPNMKNERKVRTIQEGGPVNFAEHIFGFVVLQTLAHEQTDDSRASSQWLADSFLIVPSYSHKLKNSSQWVSRCIFLSMLYKIKCQLSREFIILSGQSQSELESHHEIIFQCY